MPKLKKTYDVFLSYSIELASQATVVRKKFASEGIIVFTYSEIDPGYNINEEIWQALAESWAVVALIKPGTVSTSVGVEIGAASAWQKPIYILSIGTGEHHLPSYFSNYKMFKISEIGKLIQLILKDLKPISEKEREALVEAYRNLGIPTDKLLMTPANIDQLNKILWRDSRLRLSGERVMQELLRLRKRGKLPKLIKRK
jgi:hypothetical protein